ncbi:hypothetical protein D3C78_1388330 [compost metagenome]
MQRHPFRLPEIGALQADRMPLSAVAFQLPVVIAGDADLQTITQLLAEPPFDQEHILDIGVVRYLVA